MEKRMFVEEWVIEQILGEGAFGEVRLLLNRRTNDQIAMKLVDLADHPEALPLVHKEIALHQRLLHENIIRFYGSRKEGQMFYIFLEYASGGELFDKIEPDVGVEPSKAQMYFSQILRGIGFLHSIGIAHRDIKPENILLDANGKIKISDFGFATIFRKDGTERLLDKKCGTLPYTAPEVLKRSYKAQPADLWSCGIVLVALLAGELPWDRPQEDCVEYANWKKGKTAGHPWEKIDIQALNLMKRMLNPQPSKRFTLQQILDHFWMTKKASAHGFKRSRAGSSPVRKRIISGVNFPVCEDAVSRNCLSHSQPGGGFNNEPISEEINEFENLKSPYFSFSQPAGVDEFFLGSQLAELPSSSSNSGTPPSYHHWVQRMTRVCVKTSKDDTIKELTNILTNLSYQIKIQNNNSLRITTVTISTFDRRKMPLVFQAVLIDMGQSGIILDFRRSKGDGLEFKRHFVRIKESLKDIELSGPLSWSFARGAISA